MLYPTRWNRKLPFVSVLPPIGNCRTWSLLATSWQFWCRNAACTVYYRARPQRTINNEPKKNLFEGSTVLHITLSMQQVVVILPSQVRFIFEILNHISQKMTFLHRPCHSICCSSSINASQWWNCHLCRPMWQNFRLLFRQPVQESIIRASKWWCKRH
jgi:hypothetical protein